MREKRAGISILADAVFINISFNITFSNASLNVGMRANAVIFIFDSGIVRRIFRGTPEIAQRFFGTVDRACEHEINGMKKTKVSVVEVPAGG